MIKFIGRVMRFFLWLFLFFLLMPQLFFLLKTRYRAFFADKTYVGYIEMPFVIKYDSSIVETAKTLFSSPEIVAVLIKADGYGGDAGTCQAIFSDLMFLKKQYAKPVIAYFTHECFAGSYYIATVADAIVAPQGALVGYTGIFDFRNKNNQNMIYFNDQHMREQYVQQYSDAIVAAHHGIAHAHLARYYEKSDLVSNAAQGQLIDIVGSITDIERYLQHKMVIQGKIEYIYGSFQNFFSNCIFQFINAFKSAIRWGE